MYTCWRQTGLPTACTHTPQSVLRNVPRWSHPSKVQLSVIASHWFYLLIKQRFLTQSCLFQTFPISLDSLCISTFPNDKLPLGTLKTTCSSVYQDYWHNDSATWNISPLHVHSCTSFTAQLKSFFLQEVLLDIYIYIFFFFNWSIVDLQCCVNFRCTAQSFSYVYVCIYVCVCLYIYAFFFRFFSLIGYYKILRSFPVLYDRSLLVIYFIYSSVYMLIPNSLFILHPSKTRWGLLGKCVHRRPTLFNSFFKKSNHYKENLWCDP